jgi:tetratricopeptide (TPR) repeat protein
VQGTGAGTFEFWWNRDGGVQFIRDAHSLYFEQAAELGVPGLLLTLVLLVSLAVLALAARARLRGPSEIGAHAAVTAAFLAFLFHAGVDWMWESTAVTVLAITSGAIAVTAGAAPAARPRLARLPALGLAALALAVCLVQLPGLASTSHIRDSREAFRAGARAEAVEEADHAIEAEPWAASPYVQRAVLEESAGALVAAAVDIRRAVEREPTNWRHYLALARIEAKRGRGRRALAAYRQARRLRPRSPFFSRSG